MGEGREGGGEVIESRVGCGGRSNFVNAANFAKKKIDKTEATTFFLFSFLLGLLPLF